VVLASPVKIGAIAAKQNGLILTPFPIHLFLDDGAGNPLEFCHQFLSSMSAEFIFTNG
jgi:hypothetical protein